jgi:hypothetical protein
MMKIQRTVDKASGVERFAVQKTDEVEFSGESL